MEYLEQAEQLPTLPSQVVDVMDNSMRPEERNLTSSLTPQAGNGSSSCNGTCSAGASYVYALGNITPRFPSLGVEKEFFQAAGRGDTTGKTDQQTLYTV